MSFDAELKLIQAIERVRELHKPVTLKWGLSTKTFQECNICSVQYPCPTIKALDGEQE